MQKFELDFKNCNSINQVLMKFYDYLNNLDGGTKATYFDNPRIIWSAIEDDIWGIITDDKFIHKYGPNIHFILKNLNKFKELEPENYKNFIELIIDYQVQEIAVNKYVKDEMKFSYEIVD